MNLSGLHRRLMQAALEIGNGLPLGHPADVWTGSPHLNADNEHYVK
jgi:hypothetical protein